MEGARQLGFEFIARSMTHVTLCMLGDTVEFEILNVFEFSSERGRMSVIARTPDGMGGVVVVVVVVGIYGVQGGAVVV